MKMNQVSDILIGIIILIFVFGIGTYIVISMVDTAKNTVVDCNEYAEAKFVWVGSLLGSQKHTTESDHYDGTMEICIKGKTTFGKKWELKNKDVLVATGEEVKNEI